MMISDAISAIERKYEGKPNSRPIYCIHTTHPDFTISAMSGPFRQFGEFVQQMFDLDIWGWQVDRITDEPYPILSPNLIKTVWKKGITTVILVRIWCSKENERRPKR